MTHHVREKDEAEGQPMTKPVTDAFVAERLQPLVDEIGWGSWRVKQIGRLLHDRDVAMEVIEEVSKQDCLDPKKDTEPVHGGFYVDCFDCSTCKARALIAAVKGEG